MTSRLQCLICLDVLSLNESSAVRCGHIFHLHCILQWLEKCKTCPVCRKKTTAKDLIRQLFFQMEENKSFNFDNTDLYEMHNELQNALANLEKEKQATAKAKDEINICLATNLLLKEKMKDLELASRFNVQQIKHLESMLTQQLDMEKELEKYKKRLKAAAFYKLLSNMKDEPVLEIDKYINKEGLEIQKFITLLRRQLKDAMKMVENQKEELQENRKKISELQKKLNEHKNLNVALKKELASTRMDSSQTIMNGALEEVIAFSPKQHLFSPVDLDDRKMFPASLIASAYGSTSGNTALMEKVQETTPVRSKLEIPVFRDEAARCEKASKNELRADIENDMEEVFVPPIIRKCATLSRGALHKTPIVERSHMMRTRESLKKRSSCIEYRRKKEARCLRYRDLNNETITIE
ncbi:E3 ubiquitin-protein ligase [Dirofilaria immitis]